MKIKYLAEAERRRRHVKIGIEKERRKNKRHEKRNCRFLAWPIFHTKQEKSSCNVTTLTMERLIAWLFLRAKRPEQSGGRSGSKIKTRRGQKIKIEKCAVKIIARG